MMDLKRLKKRIRKARNRLAARFFDTRYGRDLLINAISPRVTVMTADCGDHVMSFSPHDYIGRKIYRKGHFERDHVDRLLTLLRQRGILDGQKVLLELGGNIGTQTIYFAISRAFRHIISIEPDPRNFPLLARNITDNDLQSSVTPLNCAAGEDSGDLTFFLHRDNHGKSSAIRQSATDIEVSVPVRPVTVLLEQAGFSPGEIGLIWMDIEGYEPVAARSMVPLLSARTPFYLEFSPVFYGEDGSRAFMRTLAAFYERCIVFDEDQMTEMNVVDIPLDRTQFDLLLLP